jgi:hypothetical protein
MLVLAARGHLGQGRWQFPSIQGLTYLVWTAGLMPSLVGASPPEVGEFFYGAEAKWIGALGFLVWFMAFLIGAGQKSPQQRGFSTDNPREPWGTFDASALVLFLCLWIGLGAVTARAGAISAWSPSVMQQIQGTPEGNIVLLYLAFIPLVPILGMAGWLYGGPRWRWLYGATMLIGLVGLILYSNRRLVLFIGLLLLYLWMRAGRTFRLRLVLAGGVTGFLLVGPLLWPLRMAFSNPDLISAQGNPLAIAGEAVVRYVTDPDFREVVSQASQENLQEGRFNYAGSYLAGVQWTLDHGHPAIASLLLAPVNMVPSSLWPAKNDYAERLNIKKQFNTLGITDEPDFPMTPIQEVFFQYGWLGVLVGGWFWGWMARKLENALGWGETHFEQMLVWISLTVGVLSFEGGFSAFLSALREPIILALIIHLVRKLYKWKIQIHSFS